MTIRVDGKNAFLKAGTSFDYISENRYFTGADDYTMSIEFPLKDCPSNQDIFGNINRHRANMPSLPFTCEIIDKGVHLNGVLTVVSVSDVSVKCQFLSGRTIENYGSNFDDIVINQLSLAYPNVTVLHAADVTGGDFNMYAKYSVSKNIEASQMARGYVALPWYNANTGVYQNAPGIASYIPRPFADDVAGLSLQPYLWYLLERIFDAIGYTCDVSAIKTHAKWRYLLVCNALPYVWDLHDFARALPAWSLTKLLEQVEYLLNGEFTVNHTTSSVRFDFSASVIDTAGVCQIDNVINQFETEVQDTEDIEYRENLTLKYAECDHEMQKYYACDWFIEYCKKAGLVVGCAYQNFILTVFNGLESGAMRTKGAALNRLYLRYKEYLGRKIWHISDTDTYYMVSSLTVVYTREFCEDGDWLTHMGYNCRVSGITLVRLNEFANVGDGKEIELGIVPAYIDEYYNNGYKGNCIFLNLSDYDEPVPTADEVSEGSTEAQVLQASLHTKTLLGDGEQKGTTEYLGNLFVGFWNGNNPTSGIQCPHITRYPLILHKGETFSDNDSGFTLALRDTAVGGYMGSYKIDASHKYKIKWLAQSIPSVRSLFYIHGCRFVCSKITATFTDKGMSQLLSGEFYRII